MLCVAFSYDSAYFLPKSWFGSCCTTKAGFILSEDLLSYPWAQLPEIQTRALYFSLQAGIDFPTVVLKIY